MKRQDKKRQIHMVYLYVGIDQWILDIEFLSAYFENEKPVSPQISSLLHRLHVFCFNSYESPRSTVQSMIDIVCVRFKQPLTLLFCLVYFGECNTLFKDNHFNDNQLNYFRIYFV
jgi:hypothetical protein